MNHHLVDLKIAPRVIWAFSTQKVEERSQWKAITISKREREFGCLRSSSLPAGPISASSSSFQSFEDYIKLKMEIEIDLCEFPPFRLEGWKGTHTKEDKNRQEMFSLFYGLWKYMFSKTEFHVLILGIDKAGKTTLLEKLKSVYSNLEGLSPDRIVPTVGLNIGRIEVSGTKLVFWDLGGQPGLRSIWEKYYEEAHAVIFVIDAACPSRFEDSKSALEKVLRHEDLQGAPLLILANKQDLAESVSSEELARYLDLKKLDERVYMFEAVSSYDGLGIKEGVEWLVEAMARSKRTEMLRARTGATGPASA
ncbi:hypothetical protein G4B88_019377 [Cannabis sativa]|uniref:Uncharacterized protein n=3 Tax=Cannabis sativa TaxID=3483 RepID=A0A7J6HZM6_CANSA|nr:hypothetical protein G4B88_019377 [Cannabis sativa]